MFIPIRTDYKMTRRPVVNYLLVGVNVLLFLAGYHSIDGHSQLRILQYMLHPDAPELYQFFTSMFLHANWAHLIGNMVFLWVFGNAVNDRLGHAGYLAFYLAGGILAGLGYILLSGRAPVLGASGAISAITGAYLVLLPRVRVTVLMFLYFITYFDVSSLYFLLFQFIENILMSMPDIGGAGAGGGVAYVAHTSGYAYGIAVAAVLLATGLLPRNMFDLPNLLRAAGKRRRFRKLAAEGYSPFRTRGPAEDVATPRPVPTRTVEPVVPGTPEARELELRRQIAAHCTEHDLHSAARKYLELVQIAEAAVLPQSNQLDVANHLMFVQNYPASADAYERFLRHYGTYEHVGDIFLMLGLLYGRYLHQYDRAEHCLRQAMDRLGDARKLDLARGDLAEVRRRRGL
jgi:membrane associated rhomboid family serine protease